MPVGTAVRHALGIRFRNRAQLLDQARGYETPERRFSAPDRGVRVGGYTITQGVARQKSLALPWATLLRPLRGLDVIFIDRVDLNRSRGTFMEIRAGKRMARSVATNLSQETSLSFGD